MDVDPFDLLCLQQYITTTLIERRADEKALREVREPTCARAEQTDLDELLDATTVNEQAQRPQAHCRQVGSSAARPGRLARPPTGARAASSTDPMPELQIQLDKDDAANPTAGSTSETRGASEILAPAWIHGSDSDGPGPDEPCTAEVTAPPAKKRRQTWQSMTMPPHIVECKDLLAVKLQCNLCGARATMQYR
eukprot:6126887-Amphidinium_carterae.1